MSDPERGEDGPTAGERADERAVGDDQEGAADGRDDAERRRQTLVDAGVAAVALVVVLGLGWVEGVRPRPLAAVAGALGTLAFEAATLVDADRHRRIRAIWERRWVRLAGILLTVVVVMLGTELAPDLSMSFFAGAFAAYLVFVVAALLRR